MYNKILQLIDNKSFECEYSIGCISPHGLFELSDSQKRLFENYGFDSTGWMYSREDSKLSGHECVYIRIEFINPSTMEALIFTWEDDKNN